MVPAWRASALRRGRSARIALVCAIVGVCSLCPLALASTASAGQIVWSANNAIWAMSDNGTHPHELLSGVSPQVAASLPSGTLSEPDIYQNGGTTVLFLGQTNAFAPSSEPKACGADCSGTYALSNGLLTELGPPPAPAAGTAYFETQPRVTADGQEVFSSALWSAISGGSIGASATALVERQIAAGATVNAWSNTSSETQPASGYDGAPDPADATRAAWVEQQTCSFIFTVGTVSHNACQYAIHVGGLSVGSAPVAVYDKEWSSSATGFGQGPTSLAWSPDGANLLMVDPFAPNTGIYAFPAVGDPATKKVIEVLVQPPGWTFGQARFAGSKIVFDAHQQVGTTTTGDIFTIPANCTTLTCTFPASATNLTNDPAANSEDPSWTSATEPLAALRVAGGPRVTRVTLLTKPIRTGRRFTLVVTLSAPGTIVVRIVRRLSGTTTKQGTPRTRPIGSVTLAGRAGPNALSIGLVAGRRLAPGAYSATIGVKGASTAAKTVHFTVRH
jgi:hypothetical protein